MGWLLHRDSPQVSFGTADGDWKIEFTFLLWKKTPEDSLKNKQLGHLQISPSIQKMRLAILFKFEIMRKNICKNESVEERTSSDRFKNRMDGQHIISFSTRSSHFQPLSWLLGSQLYQQDGKFNLFPLQKYKHRQIGCQDFHCYARLLEDIHCWVRATNLDPLCVIMVISDKNAPK